jgi:large subunit ribosomal protein L31e
MAIERTYVVPLRRGFLKSPRYKRAKKAVNTLRAFLVRHMKSEDVRILSELNVAIWHHGIKNPPSRVKINVKKDDKGVVTAQLFGIPFEKVEVKKEKKASTKKEAVKTESAEKPAEVKTEAPKAEPGKKAAPKKAVKKETPSKTE